MYDFYPHHAIAWAGFASEATENARPDIARPDNAAPHSRGGHREILLRMRKFSC